MSQIHGKKAVHRTSGCSAFLSTSPSGYARLKRSLPPSPMIHSPPISTYSPFAKLLTFKALLWMVTQMIIKIITSLTQSFSVGASSNSIHCFEKSYIISSGMKFRRCVQTSDPTPHDNHGWCFLAFLMRDNETPHKHKLLKNVHFITVVECFHVSVKVKDTRQTREDTRKDLLTENSICRMYETD